MKLLPMLSRKPPLSPAEEARAKVVHDFSGRMSAAVASQDTKAIEELLRTRPEHLPSQLVDPITDKSLIGRALQLERLDHVGLLVENGNFSMSIEELNILEGIAGTIWKKFDRPELMSPAECEKELERLKFVRRLQEKSGENAQKAAIAAHTNP